MAHTPGPWGVPDWNEFGVITVTNAHGQPVAGVYLWPEKAQEEANARLIAAAPDLLEAFTNYLEAEDIYNKAVTPQATAKAGYAVREKREAARAAIAKASPQAR